MKYCMSVDWHTERPIDHPLRHRSLHMRVCLQWAHTLPSSCVLGHRFTEARAVLCASSIRIQTETSESAFRHGACRQPEAARPAVSRRTRFGGPAHRSGAAVHSVVVKPAAFQELLHYTTAEHETWLLLLSVFIIKRLICSNYGLLQKLCVLLLYSFELLVQKHSILDLRRSRHNFEVESRDFGAEFQALTGTLVLHVLHCHLKEICVL